MSAAASLPTTLRRSLIAGTGLVMLILGLLIGYYVWDDYRRTLQRGEDIVTREARALAETAEATLRAAQVALLATRDQIESAGGLERLDERTTHRLLNSQLRLFVRDADDIASHAMFAVTAAGLVHSSTVDLPTRKVAVRDREYFQHFSGRDDDAALLGSLAVSRLSGHPFINLTVRLRNAKGGFGGVLGVSIRVAYFDRFYAARGFRHGEAMTLQRLDGKPIYRFPMTDRFIQSDVSDNPAFHNMARLESGVRRTVSPLDGVDRLLGHVRTDSYRMLTVVSIPMDSLIGSWRRNALIAGGVFVILTLSLVTLLMVSLRYLVAASRAEAANQAKGDLLAVVSHEIRTPLNGVIGLSRLLMGTPLNGQQRDYAEKIQSSGEVLLSVINDILDLSRIDANRLELTLADFSPAALLHDVAGMFAYRAQEKGLALVVEPTDRLPAQLHGDAARLRQVLLNLVGNAVKFTESGEVRLAASAVPTPEGKTNLAIRVSDTGVGMTPAQVERIFEPFVQVDASAARRQGGSGLGLAIVRRLTDLMGGEVRVTSAPGEGSRFIVTLQLAPAQSPAPVADGRPNVSAGAAHAALADVADGAALRVLMAEDNATNQTVALGMLAALGVNDVTVVGDGAQVLERLAGNPFDLVLMDCQMPVMDGYEATRALRAAGYRLPVVAMTANAMAGDRERCLAVGMDDFVAKPIDPALLRDVIERVSGRPLRPSVAATVSRSVENAPPADELPVFDRAVLRQRMGNDDDLLGAVVEAFVADLPGLVSALAAALPGRDLTVIRRCAHSLKGAAAGVAGLRLSSLAAGMEQFAAEGTLAALPGLMPAIESAAGELLAVLRGNDAAGRPAGGTGSDARG